MGTGTGLLEDLNRRASKTPMFCCICCKEQQVTFIDWDRERTRLLRSSLKSERFTGWWIVNEGPVI